MGKRERETQRQIQEILQQDSPAPLYRDQQPKRSPAGRSGRGLLFVVVLLAVAAIGLGAVLAVRHLGLDSLLASLFDFSLTGEVAGGSPQAIAQAPLPETADAGQSYLDDTLFLGDSNTVRLEHFGLVAGGQVKALSGIGIDGAIGHRFAGADGREDTMAETVARLTPKRVLVILGTNDLPATSAEDFAARYRQFLGLLREASPETDIIVGTVPPVDLDGSRVNNEKVRAYNAALLELCRAEGIALLDCYDALTDDDGATMAGAVEGDGIHLTQQALETLLTYYRTHALG